MTEHKRAARAGGISQSNSITEAAYSLPLQGKRVLWLCLLQCYKIREFSEDISPVFTVTVAEYAEAFGVSIHTASKDVKAGVMALGENVVLFYNEGDHAETIRPWLAEAGMRQSRGAWDITFNPLNLSKIIGLSEQFTHFNLCDVGRLTSFNAIRLYESLCQWSSKGEWRTSQQWIAERFKLPESQQRSPAEFVRTFLDPSVKKLNQRTPMNVQYEWLEDGELRFTFIKKAGA